MEVCADADAVRCDALDETARLTRHGHADRVTQDDLVRPRLRKVRSESNDMALVDSALERATERDRDGDRRSAAVGVCTPVRDRRVRVAAVERLGRAERVVDLAQRRRREPIVSHLVEHQPRIDDIGSHVRGGHDLFGSCHLRDSRRVDEARDLDTGHPGAHDAVGELGADLGRNLDGVVLQAVARMRIAVCDIAP